MIDFLKYILPRFDTILMSAYKENDEWCIHKPIENLEEGEEIPEHGSFIKVFRWLDFCVLLPQDYEVLEIGIVEIDEGNE